MGLTGAGKSTLLPTLLAGGRTLLPDRRRLTDEIVLPAAQRMEGRSPAPVTDRLERFRLTARYREEHPEGIVHALAQELAARPASGPVVFDGLRGENELQATLARFPGARYLMLLARPLTRVKRLMSRNDQFDRVGSDQATHDRLGNDHLGNDQLGNDRVGNDQAGATQAVRKLVEDTEGADRLFDPAELAGSLQGRPELAEELLRAVRIVVAEQRHYGEEGALACLEKLPGQRRLIVDSDELGPEQVAERVRTWLRASDHGQRSRHE